MRTATSPGPGAARSGRLPNRHTRGWPPPPGRRTGFAQPTRECATGGCVRKGSGRDPAVVICARMTYACRSAATRSHPRPMWPRRGPSHVSGKPGRLKRAAPSAAHRMPDRPAPEGCQSRRSDPAGVTPHRSSRNGRPGPCQARTTILPPAPFSSMQRCASAIWSRRNTRPTCTFSVPPATRSASSSSGVRMKSSGPPS